MYFLLGLFIVIVMSVVLSVLINISLWFVLLWLPFLLASIRFGSWAALKDIKRSKR